MLTEEQKEFIRNKSGTNEFYLVHRYMMGRCPGQFHKNLLLSIETADSDNRDKLAEAFPEIVEIRKFFYNVNTRLVTEFMQNGCQ